MTGRSRKISLAAGFGHPSHATVETGVYGGRAHAPRAEEAVDAGAAPEHRAQMAAVAKAEYAARRRRDRIFATDLFADPAWDMLLDLYVQRHLSRPVSIHSLCIAAAVPQTTALRWIGKLDRSGLIVRRRCPYDNRVIHVSLSDEGLNVMERYLVGQLGESGTAAGPRPTLS